MNYKIIRPRFLEVLVCYVTPFRGSPEGLENSLCPWKTKGIWREAAVVGFRPSQLSVQLLRGLYPHVLLAGPKAQRRSCYGLTVKYTLTTPAHFCAFEHLVPRWGAISEVMETMRKELWLAEMCLLGWVFESCYSTLLLGLSSLLPDCRYNINSCKVPLPHKLLCCPLYDKPHPPNCEPK